MAQEVSNDNKKLSANKISEIYSTNKEEAVSIVKELFLLRMSGAVEDSKDMARHILQACCGSMGGNNDSNVELHVEGPVTNVGPSPG